MQDTSPNLEQDLKKLIVETLRLEDIQPHEIGDGQHLFAKTGGLGLDSLSALELLSAIEYHYKVRFDSDGSAKQHFESVATLAAFVRSKTA